MRKSVQIMFHLSFWIFTGLLISLMYHFISIPGTWFGGSAPGFIKYLTALSIVLPIGVCIFYAFYYSLNFFIRHPYRFIWIALFYAILIPFLIFREKYVFGFIDLISISIVLFLLLYFNIFGFLFKTVTEWIKDRKIKAELEKDKLTSQLELLKSQINPHFLFNTLNNIDVLILDEPKKASDYLKKLSEILRFMLYETNSERVPLSKEIEYIKKYVELQKVRTLNKKFVELAIIGKMEGKFIAPMIFIHFVENAFKYATNKKIENAISIRFDISENEVSFFCKNHVNLPDVKSQDNNGLGFKLIKKRLDLIYKKDYSLNVNSEDNWYIVQLEIHLGHD